MKKNFKYYLIIWAVLLAVFNVVCFVTPDEAVGMSKFGAAFWVGYVFITAAFILQLICAVFALNERDKAKIFYNIPLIRISYIGLILTIIFGALSMAIPDLPAWIGIVVCAAVTMFVFIALLKARAAAEIVSDTDEKVKAQTFFMKSLTADAENLLARAASPEAKNACKKVYETVRYSDPASSAVLADIEKSITEKFGEFTVAVNKNTEDISALADELVVLIGERNTKCKLFKMR